MKHKQIKNISNSHYRQLNILLKKIDSHFFKNDIHQFRVEYKQFRAFLRMISMERAAPGQIKIGKKLKKVYHILGAIRDLQLQKRSIRKATKEDPIKPGEYLGLLQKEIVQLQLELTEMLPAKPVLHSKKKTDAVLPEKFPLAGLSNFVKEKKANINAIIVSGNFGDDNIHTIRKQLKDLYYNLKAFQEIKKGALSIRSIGKKDKKHFNDFLDALGNFQDMHIELNLLNPAELKRLNAYNRELLIRIKKRWQKEKTNSKYLLVKQLKTDFTLKPAS